METPPERQGHASVIMNDSLFIFGGSNESGLLSDSWMFNLRTQKWLKLTPKGDKLIARTNHSAISISESKYLKKNILT
jgi:N-acetylneuraminic acid mutarotase